MINISKFTFVLICCLSLFSFGNCDIDIEDFRAYTNKTVLSPFYNLSWTVDLRRDEIYFKIEALTTGFVGLGISEPTSGSMPGSDIVTAYVNGTTQQAFATDRFAVAFAEPTIDNCQDWHVLYGTETNTTTTIHLKRKLHLNSSEDRSIPPGPVRIIFAIGSSDKVAYHGPNRGATIIEFYRLQNTTSTFPITDKNITQIEFHMNADVPSKTTTYMCQSFDLPAGLDDGSIVKFEPLISSTGLPHHLLVYACKDKSNTSYVPLFRGVAQECISPLGNQFADCDTVIFGWAIGSGALVMPPNVGFRIGNKTPYAFTHIVMETHFTNPTHLLGVHDTTGLRITYTPHARPIDAGTLVIGDSLVNLPPIPPKQPAFAVETNCPSECTSTWPHDVNVFYDFLHMHMTGSRMFTNQFLGNTSISRTNNRADYYQFNFQQLTGVNYTITKGDKLNVHCVYNTMSRVNDTIFGVESTDEMCMNFLFHYPILFNDATNTTSSFCGYVSFGPETGYYNATVCGNNNFDLSILPVFNPTFIDPVENYPKTFGFLAPNGTVCSNAYSNNLSQQYSWLSILAIVLILCFNAF